MDTQKAPTREDLVHYLGPLDDHKVLEILSLMPSWNELEIVSAFLAGATDVMGKERKQLTGNAAVIHEIVTRDEAYLQER